MQRCAEAALNSGQVPYKDSLLKREVTSALAIAQYQRLSKCLPVVVVANSPQCHAGEAGVRSTHE